MNPLRVKLKFFSLARDAAGLHETVVELAEGSKLRDLMKLEIVKKVLDFLKSLGVEPAILVNGEKVGDEHPLRDGDEVAILPPSSGG